MKIIPLFFFAVKKGGLASRNTENYRVCTKSVHSNMGRKLAKGSDCYLLCLFFAGKLRGFRASHYFILGLRGGAVG
jgi:hypothetical protein